MSKKNATVVLTACDHEKNGFVALGRWQFANMVEASAFVENANTLGSKGPMEGDGKEPYEFILDIHDVDTEVDGGNMVGNSDVLSEELVQRMAPSEVSAWLISRPDPNGVGGQIPVLPSVDLDVSTFEDVDPPSV